MWDERTRGSVYATAQTVLIAYTDPGVLASAMSAELRAEHLLDGGCHTAYLCAPAHEQRRLQPLFATLVQEIVAHAYDRATETGKPLDPPLLLVLDECANIAPLRELATLASTGAGQGIQLVSVFQDIAQINAVYGRDRAPDDRLQPPRQGDPLRHRRPADARVRRPGCSATRRSARYRRPRAPRAATPPPSPSPTATSRPRTCSGRCGQGQGVLVYGHLPPARIALRPWFKERAAASTREARPAPYGGRAIVKTMLEDLSTLPPKRLERQLETLAHDALPCHAVTVFEGDPDAGLTVALHVDSRGRGEVLDLARVVEDDPAVQASCGWSLLPPTRRHDYWRLLLRVSFERPVHVRLSLSASTSQAHPSDPLRGTLPLLLAASRLVFAFDGRARPRAASSSGSRPRSHASPSSSCSRPSAYSPASLIARGRAPALPGSACCAGSPSGVRSSSRFDARSTVRDWSLASSSKVTASARRASATFDRMALQLDVGAELVSGGVFVAGCSGRARAGRSPAFCSAAVARLDERAATSARGAGACSLRLRGER